MNEETTEKWNQLKQKLDNLEEEKAELIKTQQYEAAALWRDKARKIKEEIEWLTAI